MENTSALVKQFKKQFNILKTRYGRGDKLYVSVDVHETVFKPTHSTELSTEYYSFAKETLRLMSKHQDVVLILWTSSLPEIAEKYVESFKEDNINFKYINSNPEIKSPVYADFSLKFFVNVIIDDKAGWIAEEDWEPLHNYFLDLFYSVNEELC